MSESASPQPTDGREALLPCPFCGKSDLFVEREDFTSSYVMCNDCSARGPAGCQDGDDEETPGKDAAGRVWNARSTSRVTSHDGREALNVDLIAAAVHEGRFPDGKASPIYCSFDDERDGGKEYCRRIARSVMAALTSRVEAPVHQPTSPSVNGERPEELEKIEYYQLGLWKSVSQYLPPIDERVVASDGEQIWLDMRTEFMPALSCGARKALYWCAFENLTEFLQERRRQDLAAKRAAEEPDVIF